MLNYIYISIISKFFFIKELLIKASISTFVTIDIFFFLLHWDYQIPLEEHRISRFKLNNFIFEIYFLFQWENIFLFRNI